MPLTSPTAAVSQKPSQSGFAGGGTGTVGSQTVALNSPQKLRITYQQGVPNSVTCVSSVEQLNAYGLYGSEKLAAYDEAFFESSALVLVKYTVNSGSTQLSLGSATQVSNMVSVHIDAQPADHRPEHLHLYRLRQRLYPRPHRGLRGWHRLCVGQAV